MSNTKIPVIVLGKTEQVGKIVVDALQPDYEVISFIMSLEEATTNIPRLLSVPPQPAIGDNLSSLGSGDYTRNPQAILLGGGFDDEARHEMQRAVKEHSKHGKVSKVLWLAADMTKRHPDSDVQPGPSEKYALWAGERVRTKMDELKKDGRLGNSEDGEDLW